ncbi:unnamed protein product, partial [Rotaria magnacalcarata]
MNLVSIEITVLLLFIVTIICHTETTTKRTISAPKLGFRRCQKQKNGQRLCFCGKTNTVFDRLKGERCINGQVIKKGSQQSDVSKFSALRITTKPIHRSARDDSKDVPCIKLLFKPPSSSINEAYVPLRNVSVEAWIDSFAADVTLTQVFFNQEEDPIEAIYVFPIEVCQLEVDFSCPGGSSCRLKGHRKRPETAIKRHKTALIFTLFRRNPSARFT